MTKMGEMLAQMKKEKAWQQCFEPNAPKPGDLAPDLKLRDVAGENSVRLSDFRGKKPAALVFGSYT